MIEKASLDDLAKVFAFSSQWDEGGVPTNEYHLANFISDGNAYLALNEDEEVVGVMLLGDETLGSILLARLFVLEDYRGEGIGSELLTIFTDMLDQRHNEACVVVDIDNVEAQRLYARFDFIDTEPTDTAFDSERYIQMMRMPSG